MQPSRSPVPIAQTPGPNTISGPANSNDLPSSTSSIAGYSLTQSQLPQFTQDDFTGHWQFPQGTAGAKQWPGAAAGTRALISGPSAASVCPPSATADLYKPSKVPHTPLMRENSVPLKLASPNTTLMQESPLEMRHVEQSGTAGMGSGLVDLQAMQAHEMLYGGLGSLGPWGDAGASWFGPMSMSRTGMNLQQASGMGMGVGPYAAANYMLTPPFSPGSQYLPAANNNNTGIGSGATGNGNGNGMGGSQMGMGMGVGGGPQPFYMDYPSGAALYAAGHAYPSAAAASYFAAYQLAGTPVNLPTAAAAAQLGDYLSPNSAAAAQLANAANSAIAMPASATGGASSAAMSSSAMQPPMSGPPHSHAHPISHKHSAQSHGGAAGGEHRRSTGSSKARGAIAQHVQMSPSSASSVQSSFGAQFAMQAVAAAAQAVEEDCDPRDLEAFAERFKQRRIKLGVTQADVGKALIKLKIPGIGSLSQSTICRFESLTLSHNNMVALKPVLQLWLQHAEAEVLAREQLRVGPNGIGGSDDGIGGSVGMGVTGAANDRKRKRTSITDAEKRSLEAYFVVQARPTSERIAQIAERLLLRKNVVRVWFCNQRQKQKRLRFAQTAGAQQGSQGVGMS